LYVKAKKSGDTLLIKQAVEKLSRNERPGYMRKMYNFFTSRYFIVPAVILYGLYKLGETA